MSLRKLPLVLLETVALAIVVLPFAHLRPVLAVLRGALPLSELAAVEIFVRTLLLVGACQVVFFFNDLYDWKVIRNRHQTSIRMLESCSYSLILVALLYFALDGLDRFLLDVPQGQARLGIYKSSIVSTVVGIGIVYFAGTAYRRACQWMLFRIPIADRLLMIGDGPMAEVIERELGERADPGYAIAGYVLPEIPETVPKNGHGEPRTILGAYGSIVENVKKHGIGRVVVCLSERRGNLPLIELLNCRLQGVKVEEGELLYERLTGKIAVEKLRPSYLIFSEGFNRSKFNYIFKRALDVFLALLGLVLSLPLCLATALAIKLTSRGPILFSQARVGKEGRIFTLYKFRSMRADAEKSTGPVWAAADDARVTAVGRIIRQIRIDEIPQLINVLANDMSFVGPRPERPFFVEELKKDIPYYTERLVVKPGITGWAQINYRYGASKEDALEKLQYDLYYIKNMSIFLDVIILLRTVKVVLLGFGAR